MRTTIYLDEDLLYEMRKAFKYEELRYDLLYDLYTKQEKSPLEVSKIFNCSTRAIFNYLYEYHIPIRSSMRLGILNLDKDLLYILYVKHEKNQKEIGKFLGCSNSAVGSYLRKYNIPIRPLGRKKDKVGTRKKSKDGYIFVYLPNHPNGVHQGRVAEHRLVYEAYLNGVSYEAWLRMIEKGTWPTNARFLKSWEIIHHKNGIKDDNRLTNLRLVPSNLEHLVMEKLIRENKRLKKELNNKDRIIKELRQ